MSQAPKLTTYRFRVYAGDPEDPQVFEIHGFGRDVQRAEQLFAERHWGPTTDRPMTAAAAVSYFAMSRTGQFAGKWEDFESWYLSIEPDSTVTAVPTDAGPVPAYP